MITSVAAHPSGLWAEVSVTAPQGEWLQTSAIVGVVALALLFDFTNGFHDAANSAGTMVATRVMRPRPAVIYAAFFNFIAFFVVGTAVANTVAKTVKEDYITIAVIFSALMAAIAWNLLTWWFGIPSSSSHALIGGLVGAGIAVGGASAVNWGSVRTTAIAIVASPVIALAVAVLAMWAIRAIQRATKAPDNHKAFKVLQLVSSAATSFGHGANDAQKTMGVIAALLVSVGHLQANADHSVPVPTWVAFACYATIALGTVYGGWKIMETMGLKITRLHASSAVAANIGACTAIFGATGRGIPISTTQATAGSIAGAGLGYGSAVHPSVFTEMGIAWVFTVPGTMLLAGVVHWCTTLSTIWAWGTVGGMIIAGVFATYWAITHTLHADELEAEIPDEAELAGEPVAA